VQKDVRIDMPRFSVEREMTVEDMTGNCTLLGEEQACRGMGVGDV
jgi:hypothetical protein